MLQTALVTGADRGLGLALCANLLQRGWNVFAGQYLPDWPELNSLAGRYPHALTLLPLDVSSIESAKKAAQIIKLKETPLDLIINNAGIISSSMYLDISQGQDYNEIHRMFDINALGPLRVVEAFLPLMENSGLRRLCFVSSEAGSIGDATRQSWYGYCMSKAALNMAVKILFNDLRPKGYSFRLIHPGWIRSYMSGKKNMEADLEPGEAAAGALEYFLKNLPQSEEDHLVLRSPQGKEWSW